MAVGGDAILVDLYSVQDSMVLAMDKMAERFCTVDKTVAIL